MGDPGVEQLRKVLFFNSLLVLCPGPALAMLQFLGEEPWFLFNVCLGEGVLLEFVVVLHHVLKEGLDVSVKLEQNVWVLFLEVNGLM